MTNSKPTGTRYSRSPEAQAWQSWYKTKEWKALRFRQLHREPYCQCPHHVGKHYPANIVDHVKAHKGDRRLFFNPNNLMSMNKECHDRFKQSQEKGGKGFDAGCDENGEPLNKDHHWYK